MNVAVIIPTYNRASFLADAIDSSLAQSVECRVIVVDDGSTDATPEVAQRYGQRIVYHRQRNSERGAARNAGAKLAGGAELLLFVDSDDVLAPGHVEQLCRLAAGHPDSPFVAARLVAVDERMSPLHYYQWNAAGPIRLEDFLCCRETIGISGAAIRRAAFERVGGFDEDRALSGSEDWLLFARLLSSGVGVRGREATSLIRAHGGNSMGNATSMRRSMLLAHERYFAAAPIAARAWRRKSRARLLVNSATAYYGVGATGAARADLWAAIADWPGALLDPWLAWTALRSTLPPSLSTSLRRHKRSLRQYLWARRSR